MAAWSDRDDTAHIDEERVARQLEIQAGRVAIVFDSQPLAIMVTLLVATILAVVLWPVISHDTILTWLALTYLVNTWRWAGTAVSRRRRRSSDVRWPGDTGRRQADC